MSNIRIVDNSPKILTAFEEQIKLALDSIGETAEGYAKDDCPVDTGNLRNSINYAVKGNAVYIGTNVVYGKYVEFNDRARHINGKAHFLRDAATTHGKEYKAIAEAALRE